MIKIQRLGDVKNGGYELIKPVYTGGNVYIIKKICTVCGLPVRNAGRNADVCKDTYQGKQDKKILSQCQRIQMARNQKICRAREKELGLVRKQYVQKSHRIPMTKRAIRTCLRCENPKTGKPTKFLSINPFHRLCPNCSNAKSEIKKTPTIKVDTFKHLKPDRLFNTNITKTKYTAPGRWGY